jgi:hypothetical protein
MSRQGGSGKKVGRATLVHAEQQHEVFRDRAYREKLAGTAGQRELDLKFDWTLSSQSKIRESDNGIIVVMHAVSMVGGTL